MFLAKLIKIQGWRTKILFKDIAFWHGTIKMLNIESALCDNHMGFWSEGFGKVRKNFFTQNVRIIKGVSKSQMKRKIGKWSNDPLE